MAHSPNMKFGVLTHVLILSPKYIRNFLKNRVSNMMKHLLNDLKGSKQQVSVNLVLSTMVSRGWLVFEGWDFIMLFM